MVTSFSAETFQIAPRVKAIPTAATTVLDFQFLGLDHQPPAGDLLLYEYTSTMSIDNLKLPDVLRIRITANSTLK